MRRLLIAVPLLLLVARPPPRSPVAGRRCGLSSTPEGAKPGEPWMVDMTVLQHGRTPLEGVHPIVTISNGDARKTFTAKADRGARRLPRVGDLPDRRAVDLPGRRRVHLRPAAHVPGGRDRRARHGDDRTAPTTSDDGGPSLIWLIPGLALLAAAAGVLLFARRPRRGGQHQPQAA